MISTSIKRLLREPLLHFILLGAALFAGYAYLKPAGVGESARQIVLTLDDLAQLQIVFESQWRHKPNPQEFSRLIETKIRQRACIGSGLEL